MKKFLSRFASFASIFVLVAGLVTSVYLVQRKTEFFPKALGEPANISANVSALLPATASWQNYAQGGEEKNNMLLPVSEKVSALSPRYIRIDHIYDGYDVVSRATNGQLAFNWEKLDSAISTISSTGAKPFLSLSYMPLAISQGTVTDLPLSWDEWELLVRATIERYSGQEGFNIEGVYYEVWNEPDLFGGFKLYGDKNYLDLYEHTVTAAESAVNINTFKIGGPATTELYPNWFNDFLSYVSKQGLRLDFYSWHRYGDIESYEEDVRSIRSWLSSYPRYQGIELIISEMGYSSKNDPAYDGRLSAIHSIAAITQIEGLVQKAFSFELKDGLGDQKYWGRWGVLTHEQYGEPEEKDRYRAFLFLNSLSTEHRFLVTGEGYWVKALGMTDGNIIKLLIVNFDPEGKHFETVPISFTGLPSSNFILRRTDFLGEVREQPVSIDSDTWETKELFAPNTAAIFEIVPR